MNRPGMLAILAAFLLTGCASLSEAASTPTTLASNCGYSRGVVLIVGAHRNAPAPSLDQRLACQVSAAIHDGKPVLLVVASGQPKLITPQLMIVNGGTLAQQGSPEW